MDQLNSIWNQIRTVLNFPLANAGKISITLSLILYIVALLVLLFYISAKIRNWVADGLLARRGIDIGVRQAAGAILRYAILFLGFIIILQTAGIDLSALAILTGAIGIGIGFGLQNVINNFVSGLIILFERPIKVGDRIEVDGIEGDVVRISARATTIMTNNNIAVIVPNSEFVSSKVINWSFPNPNVRCTIPVGVASDSDPEFVRQLLLEIANENPGVLKEPASDVLFQGFGETSLDFVLRVWTRDFTHQAGVLKSELNFQILNKFRDNAVEFPRPKNEIHLRHDPT